MEETIIDAGKITTPTPKLKFPNEGGTDFNSLIGDIAPLTPQSVTRRGDDFFVLEGGNERPIDLTEFQELGINADFVQPGTTVSLTQAQTGKAPSTSQKQLTQSTNQQNALIRGYIDSLTRLGTQSARRGELEEEVGIDESTKQLQETNLQIAQLRGEFDKQIEALTGQGRGITTDILGRQENKLLRQKAVELGALAGVAQALQGNITLGQQIVDRALNIEFEPIRQELEMTKVFLDLNADQLSGAQKQVAEEYRAEIEAQQRALDAQEAERKGVLDIALRAASNGASNATINAILQAQTQEAAISTAGGSLASRSGGGGAINLSTSNRTSLLGAGFTQDEIASIENDVRVSGIKEVLKNPSLSEAQRVILASVYGAEEVLSEVEEELAPEEEAAWWQFWK